jgi:hypothetical protein
VAKSSNAIIGVSDHGGWAIFVTVARDGTILDRRRVELVAPDLPKLPHHTEGQGLPIDKAVELIERVSTSAKLYAQAALAAVATDVSSVCSVALRRCPTWLPPTIAERIQDYRSQNIADWVMYRKALAAAAESRGLAVHWFDAKTVLQSPDLDARSKQARRVLGPPWGQDHKLAMAAATEHSVLSRARK